MTMQLVLSANDRASRVIEGVTRSLRGVANVGRQVRETGESMARAGAALDASARSLDGAVSGLTQPAMEFETAVARLNLALGDESTLLDDARTGALAWQRAHSQSAGEYLATTQELVGAGLDQAHAIGATEAALRVATATSGDAVPTARLLGMMYRQLGDQSADAKTEIARLGDQLVRTQQLGGIVDAAELTEPLRDAIPVAQRLGVTSEQTLAILARLNRVGIRGGEAGGSFRDLAQGLTQLQGFDAARTADGNLDLVRTIERVRETYGDLGDGTMAAAKLQEQLGDSGFRALVLLSNEGDHLRETLDGVTDSTGAAEAAQRSLESTTSARLAIVRGQVDALATEIGSVMLPRVQELIPHVTAAVSAMGDFADAHPDIVQLVSTILVMTVAVAGTLGPVLMLGGGLLTVGGQALEAADRIGDMVSNVRDFALEAGPAAMSAARSAAASLQAMGQAAFAAAQRVWALVTQMISYAVNAVRQFVVSTWQAATALMQRLFPATTAAISAIASLVRQMIMFAVNAVRQFIASVIASATALATRLYAAAVSAAQAVARLALQAMAFAVRAAAPFIASVARMAASLAMQLVTSVASASTALVAFAATAIASAIAGLDALIAGALGAAGTMIAGLVPAFAAATTGATAFAAAVLANPITWIVGGAILAVVALTAAFVGLLVYSNPEPFVEQWDAMSAAFDAGGIEAALRAFHPVDLLINAFAPVTAWIEETFRDIGSGMMGSLASSMIANARAPVDAMLDVVQQVRDLLPFSPARTGPLSDLDQIQLVETVAASVRPEPLVDAVTSSVGAARSAFQEAGPIGGGVSRGGAQVAPVMNVTIALQGGGDRSVAEQLEAWIRDPSNGRRLASALSREQQRGARATEVA